MTRSLPGNLQGGRVGVEGASCSFSLLLPPVGVQCGPQGPTQALLPCACPCRAWQLTPQLRPVCILEGQEARGLSLLPAFSETMVIRGPTTGHQED